MPFIDDSYWDAVPGVGAVDIWFEPPQRDRQQYDVRVEVPAGNIPGEIAKQAILQCALRPTRATSLSS